jgi:hypothetical protein
LGQWLRAKLLVMFGWQILLIAFKIRLSFEVDPEF